MYRLDFRAQYKQNLFAVRTFSVETVYQMSQEIRK